MAHPMPPPPGPPRRAVFGSVTRSTIFPLAGDRSALVGKAHLIPVAATILTGLALAFASQLQFIHTFPIADLNSALQDCWILGAYITFMVNYFVYMLCGRDKPWWLPAATFVVMAVLIAGPLGMLAGAYNTAVMQAFGPIVGSFVGPGVIEEIIKALPVFALAVVAIRSNDPFRQRIGVTEPLDGILIGVASATAFVMIETLMLYVPGLMAKTVNATVQAVTSYNAQHPGAQLPEEIGGALGVANAQFAAIRLFLIRVVPEIAGHVAYAGIFGYFIGLAVLKRSHALPILLIGFVSAAALHGAWDAALSVKDLPTPVLVLAMLLISLVGYAFLGSAILKGRKLSPTRAQNFASVVVPMPPVAPPSPPPPPPPFAPVQPRAQPASPQPMVAPAATPSPAAGPLAIRIGPAALRLVPGLAIEPMHLGSAGAGRGRAPIAEIAANPNDRNVLGLRNLSDRTYRVTLTGGQTIDLPKGKSVRLAPGLVIDFGGIAGRVETA